MDSIKDIVKNEWGEELISIKRCSGGSINEVFECNTKNHHFVIKVNEAKWFPLMFEKEAQGLSLLTSSSFRIPKVLKTGTYQKHSYLMLEYIDDCGKTMNVSDFGGKLAKLHLLSSDHFGLNHDNYIGSIPQKNKTNKQWSVFYQSMRIEPLVKKAFDKGELDISGIRIFDRFYLEFEHLFPKEPPSLLHGDLWQGNVICDKDSSPVLIDPAVYYGHREMDLAMLLLFGDISERTIDAYNNIYPLDMHWKNRTDIHQLYPLLVHLLLFGASYRKPVEAVVKKYT